MLYYLLSIRIIPLAAAAFLQLYIPDVASAIHRKG